MISLCERREYFGCTTNNTAYSEKTVSIFKNEGEGKRGFIECFDTPYSLGICRKTGTNKRKECTKMKSKERKILFTELKYKQYLDTAK